MRLWPKRVHPSASYWNQGVQNVPGMTGASHALLAQDIPSICADLKIPLPMTNVLDVGCGTGRLARWVEKGSTYLGVDISRDCVEYAKAAGLDARLISGPSDLPSGDSVFSSAGRQFDIITCLSVFTHINRVERECYLHAFMSRTNHVMVDVIDGDGSGDVRLWTADRSTFFADVFYVGWQIIATTQRTSPQGVTHTYYHLHNGRTD